MKPSSKRGFRLRFFSVWVAAAAAALTAGTPSLANTVTYTGTSVVFEGTTTGTAGPLGARATFTNGGGGVLKLLLENTSPSPTEAPADLLTSFYFNVLSGTTTGVSAPLTYQSAVGQVYLANDLFEDFPATWIPPIPPSTSGSITYPDPPQLSNLQAFNQGDDTWQFRDGLGLATTTPPLAFGVGTVGNSNFDPYGFVGNIVGNDDFGIYVGDVTTSNLDGRLLVKNSISFEFAGFGDFGLSQISPYGVFGFGSSPEFIITVPEPAGLVIALIGAGGCALGHYRRRARALALS